MTASDILAFINARLNERETAARAAIAASAHCGECAGKETGEWIRLPKHPQAVVDAGRELAVVGYWEIPNAIGDHVCLNDPRWVLADIAAKRRILERHQGYHTPAMCSWCSNREECTPWPCEDVLDLASAWSDHPDYNPAWAV